MDIQVVEQLFPNILTIVTQLCATGVLLYFAKKFLWAPGREMLAKRQELMQSRLTDAEKLKEAAAEEKANAEGHWKNANKWAEMSAELQFEVDKLTAKCISLEKQRDHWHHVASKHAAEMQKLRKEKDELQTGSTARRSMQGRRGRLSFNGRVSRTARP